MFVPPIIYGILASGNMGVFEPSTTMSFDSFEYYNANISVIGLNSGSNYWNASSPDLRYFARTASAGIKEYDNLDVYSSSALLSASLAGDGVGPWSGSYDYYGRIAFFGYRNIDVMSSYVVSSNLSGSAGGVKQDPVIPWSDPWDRRDVVTT